MSNYLRVWHTPQISAKDGLGNLIEFNVGVADIDEAVEIINMLARYDLFQYNSNIKPDYCNASGLEEDIDGEWQEWLCPKTGDDIGEIIRLKDEEDE